MSEDIQNQEVDNQVADAPDAVETEARASGWVPKDDFHGDPNKWVDAGEFVRRAPLFQKLDLQNRELKELRKGLEELKQHHSKVRETEYKRALAELKTQKRDAFVEGDPDKIVEIEEQMEVVKEAQRKFEQQQEQAQRAEATETVHPEFAAWSKRNSWYETSKPMKAFADALGIELRASGLSPSDVLVQVEKQVKEEFPSKFRNPNRDKASSVEGASNGKSGTNRTGEATLSDDERRIMNTFVRSGIMTKEQYIADLKKVKGDN